MGKCLNGSFPRSVHVAMLTALTGPGAEPAARVCRAPQETAVGGNRNRGESVMQETAARGTSSALVTARGAAPEFAVRFAGALLAVAVAAVHVADQGGVTA